MPRTFGTTNAAPYANAPAVGAEGDMYFNTTNDTLYLSDGINWIQVQGGSGATGQEFYVVAGTGSTVTAAYGVVTTVPIASTWLQNTSPLPWTRNADGSMTCAIPGEYVITFSGQCSTNLAANNQRLQWRIELNGVPVAFQTASTPYPDGSVTYGKRFAVGDVIRLTTYTDSNPGPSVYVSSMSAHRVGAGATGPQGPMGPVGPTGPSASVFDGFTRRYTTGVDGSFSLPVGSNAIPLGTVVSASGAVYTPNAGNTVFTIPADGIYDISAQASSYSAGWPADQVIMLFVVNGVAIAREYPKQGFGYQSITMAISYPLKAGDGISLVLYTGVATTVRMFPGGSSIDPPGPYLSVWRHGSGPPGPQGIQGPVGPDIAAAQSSYLFANTASALTSSTNWAPVTWQTAVFNQGWTFGGAAMTCTQAGKYRVGVIISGSCGGTASAYRITRIAHYGAGAVVKATRDVVNPATAANMWGDWFAEAILDMAVGDYVRIEITSDVAIQVDQSGRNWLTITPVGGVKGDKGDTGPDIATAMSSYFFGTAPAQSALGTDVTVYPAWTPISANGFTVSGSGAGLKITATNPGKYRVFANLGWTNASVAATYTRCNLFRYNSLGVQQNNQQGLGTSIAAGGYGQGVNEAVFDMVAGDYIQALGSMSNASGLLNQNTYITITPVGGNKGDKGDKGDPGGPIATGGKPFQVITKRTTVDYDVMWRTPPAMPGNLCWRTPTGLNNGWSNYSAPFNPAQFSRRNGVVYLRGLINRGANGSAANLNFMPIEAGYAAWCANGPNASGQSLLWWCPAAAGAQLARVDLFTNGRSGGYMASSDQYGSGVTNAGWMSISNISWLLDELNGIESGFEITAYADGSVYVGPGVSWHMGVRYEFDGVTLPNMTGTVRIVFVSAGQYANYLPTSGPQVGQFSDSSEAWAKANAQANGWGNDGSYNFGGLHMIASRTGGTWSDRREWA